MGRRFLVATGTTAFLAPKGDTLLCEAYVNGGRHDATVSSYNNVTPPPVTVPAVVSGR